jgi:hypothetical protein
MTKLPESRNESPKERGRRWGIHFRAEGRNYGRMNNNHYPSNPYPYHSADAVDYDEGYQEGFDGI